MTRPRPVMACTSCGPVITEKVYLCPLCGNEYVHWIDLPLGLETEAKSAAQFPDLREVARLMIDAANLIREQQAELEALKPDAGAKRRRQELKARRLAEVIEDDWGFRPTPELIAQMQPIAWDRFTVEVNDRYRSYHNPPSDETKALVAEMFAEPQKAER